MPDVHPVDAPADVAADRAEPGAGARPPEPDAGIRPGAERLFRAEALEQYQRGSTVEGHLLEVEPAWTRRAYRLILALFAAAVLFSVLARIDREAVGVGVVREGRLIVLVPARYQAELRIGAALRFDLSGRQLAVTSVSRKLLASSAARRLLGPDGAPLWTSPEPAVRIEAVLPPGDDGDGVAGRVRVRLGRERLLFALVPALRGGHV